jgi:hypothetical protein
MAVAISFVFLLLFPLLAQSQEFDPFIYHGFNGSEETITREGASIIKPSGALRLTNTSQNVAGHAFYTKKFKSLTLNLLHTQTFLLSTHRLFLL